jgi:hypothetical protein
MKRGESRGVKRGRWGRKEETREVYVIPCRKRKCNIKHVSIHKMMNGYKYEDRQVTWYDGLHAKQS